MIGASDLLALRPVMWVLLGAAASITLVWGPSGPVALLLAAAAGLALVTRRSATAVADPPRGDELDDAARGCLADLTDDQLCRAWRSSCLRLRRLAEDPQRTSSLAAAAVERSWYLDELERRSPTGFAAWMLDQPRAGSDPTPYLRHDG